MTRAEKRLQLEEALLVEIERRAAAGERFAALKVDDLVAAVGISRSKFYVYFERKSDLLRAWFARFLVALEDDMTWWARSPDFTHADLRAALARLSRRYREHAALMRACHELAAQEAGVRRDFEDSYRRTHRALRAHIRAGQQEGWVNPELEPGEAAAWLTSMMERGLSDIVAPASAREIDAIVDACAEIMWLTMYSPPP